MTINLQALIGTEIMLSDSTRQLNIKGVTRTYHSAIIPPSMCKFNDFNGRIATYISQYVATGNVINKNNIKEYNEIIGKFIEGSNPQALKATKKNIDLVGQLVPGVILNDGTIVDGNRRFEAIRQLQAEGKDIYFLAVILDETDGINQKDIKLLELQLQHAEEQRVDYNPIDNLVDVYRDVIENKLFTINEYTVAIGKDPKVNKDLKDVKFLIKKALLMSQFLEFINAPKQYYIARDFALDGPLHEMVGIIERTLKGIDILTVMNKDYEDRNEQAQYIRIRNSLFAAIFAARSQKNSDSGDLSRYIRETGKYILKTSSSDEFLDQMDDIVDDMMDTFGEDTLTIETLGDVAKNLTEVNTSTINLISEKIEDVKREKAQFKPIDLLNSAFKHMESIELDQVKHMDDNAQNEFILVYEQLKKKLEALGKALHV